jgi:VanZ family protein
MDSFSASKTSKFFGPILRFFFPDISPQSFEFWHGVFRKGGHVTEYFALAVLAYRAFRSPLTDSNSTAKLTMAFIVAVAIGDEFHQLFTVSRGGSMVDVGFDCFGAVAALSALTHLEMRRLTR